MPTSLEAQLKKLRVPQTSILLQQDKTRPSLLFDSKEAANLDRETVYSIGKNGLEDLINLSQVFKKFESTLFAQSSINLERSVHDENVNKRLNNEIQEFLIVLSPYFLLNAAHKSLEWLIYRFHIQEYNKDDFMMLILPYHDTKIFVKAIQLFDLSNDNDNWNWLNPLKKPGVALSSTILVVRLSTDNYFLKILCNHILKSTSIYKKEASCLTTLYAFYTMSIVGAIERFKKIDENKINHMLLAIACGLKSQIADFAASSYMILTKLLSRVRLVESQMEMLFLKAFKKPILKYELMLTTCYLYEMPYNQLTFVSEKLVCKIAKTTWFCDEILKVKSTGLNVSKFLSSLIIAAIKYTLKHKCKSKHRGSDVKVVDVDDDEEENAEEKEDDEDEEDAEDAEEEEDDDEDEEDDKDDDDAMEVDEDDSVQSIKALLNKILSQVTLNDDEVDTILKNTLKPSLSRKNLTKDGKKFLSKLYHSFERRYSSRFDEFLKNLMTNSKNDRACKKTLEFLMDWHFEAKKAKNSLDILNRLNDYSPQQRIFGLKCLSKDNVKLNKGFIEMIKTSLLERFCDDDVDVLKELLNFSVSTLKNFFTTDIIIDQLLILLSGCHTPKNYILAKPALNLLLKICDNYNDTNVFVATLPYLFPYNEDEAEVAFEILQSDFAKNNNYLKSVIKDLGDDRNSESICTAAFHNILNNELLPPVEKILESLKLATKVDATFLLFNLILLGSVCRVPVGSLSPKLAKQVIEISSKFVNEFPRVKELPSCNQITAEKVQEALLLTSDNILPLQVTTYVLEMVHRRLDLQSNSILNFENNIEYSQLILSLIEIFFQGMKIVSKRHYTWCIKIFIQRHFSSIQYLLSFLSQLFIKPIKPQISLHCLEITLAFLNQSKSINWIFTDKIFIANLLIALTRKNKPCRAVAVDILRIISQTFNLTDNGCAKLISKLGEISSEIAIDYNCLSVTLYQLLSPDPDVQSLLSKSVRQKYEEAREFLFDIIMDDNIPTHITSQLLEVLTYVNGPKIIELLVPKAQKIWIQLEKEGSNKTFAKLALKNIIQRFNSTTVDALKNEKVLKFFNSILTNYQLELPTEYGNRYPSFILLKEIDEIFFDKCGKIATNLQKNVLNNIIDIATNCDINNINIAAHKVLRKIKINSQLIIDKLKLMKEAELPDDKEKNKNKKLNKINLSIKALKTHRPEIINTNEWKHGICILELIQRGNNIINEELLLPILFELLEFCLSFDEISPFEYTNQLLLTTIYYLSMKNYNITDAHKQVDLISRCIRLSQNPQTHHYALLVLVELFKVADVETSIQNIMSVFTFMGSSVLRQDDAYSIQIITKIIETIVPIINAANNEIHACTIFRIFIQALPDIPEHRRLPLFIKLLNLLENYIYIFYLLIFERTVLVQNDDDNNKSKTSIQRLEFALTISNELTSKCIIDSAIQLVKFVKSLPIDPDKEKLKQLTFNKKYIFDINHNSSGHFRHFKYLIIHFLKTLLTSSNFINRIALLNNDDIDLIRTSYDELIIELILLIQNYSKKIGGNDCKNENMKKYWDVFFRLLCETLNAVNNLLPNQIFIKTIKQLINHDVLIVRRKVLDSLNLRLQQKAFNDTDHDNLLTLIEPLSGIILRSGKILSMEMETIQQTALLSMRLLTKLLASEYPKEFKGILDLTIQLLKNKEGPLLGSVVLCVAELCVTMGSNAIQYLNKFFPAIIQLLSTHCNTNSPDVLVLNIVSALNKLVESFGNFLSFYLDELLIELSRLLSTYTDNDNQKVNLIISKLKATCLKISNSIPMRVLLPAVTKTYDQLIECKSYEYIPALMDILAESFDHISPGDLQLAISNLTTFFLKVLQFREEVERKEDQMEIDQVKDDVIDKVTIVEKSIGKTLVSLVLKLSESTFRPFYYKLFDWASRSSGNKNRKITFYRLSADIAECLKSLFVLFAEHFLQDAALLLKENNPSINDTFNENTMENETNQIYLIESILLTLFKVFSYDPQNFINQEKFETLAQPIVDQIENTLGSVEEYKTRAKNLLVPCIASFSNASQDDTLHKKLVYQILLKTRHNNPCVRNVALSALVEIARKLGEDFMPLLPETIPFLAELLEDDDEETETAAQNAVRTLEDILGEPLQKYF